MENAIKISRVVNGYVLSWDEQETETQTRTYHEIIEDCENDKETMTRVLKHISTYFGEFEDNYASGNLNITWDRKGRKVA